MRYYEHLAMARQASRDAQIAQTAQIVATTPSFAAQVEAIADKNGWCMPGDDMFSVDPDYLELLNQVLPSFLSDPSTLTSVIDSLATPIEQHYLEHIVGTDKQAPQNCPTDNLWHLWWAILHAARKASWDDESNNDHKNLINLLLGLTLRLEWTSNDNDETQPGTAAEQARYAAFAADPRCWENNTLLGPAITECLCTGNDAYAEPEVQAYLNLAAFMARLSLTWSGDLYMGKTVLPAATEGSRCRVFGPVDPAGDKIAFRVALVWLKIAGEDLWERCCRGSVGRGYEGEVPLDIDPRGKKCPWPYTSEDGTSVAYTKQRWSFWKRRFALVGRSRNAAWSEGSVRMAREAAELMGEIEKR